MKNSVLDMLKDSKTNAGNYTNYNLKQKETATNNAENTIQSRS